MRGAAARRREVLRGLRQRSVHRPCHGRHSGCRSYRRGIGRDTGGTEPDLPVVPSAKRCGRQLLQKLRAVNARRSARGTADVACPAHPGEATSASARTANHSDPDAELRLPVGSARAAKVRSRTEALKLTIELSIGSHASGVKRRAKTQPSFLISACAAAGLRALAPEMK